MARATVFRYKGREVDAAEVRRDLNVRAVMMGRVLQIGDNLVIKTELMDTADGSQLWGEQYRRKAADIFEVQEEISKEISEKLQHQADGRREEAPGQALHGQHGGLPPLPQGALLPEQGDARRAQQRAQAFPAGD